MKTIYEEYSDERKELQKKGEIPEWFTTLGWQMIKEKYLYRPDDTMKTIYRRIADCAAKHVVRNSGGKESYDSWSDKFFKMMWNGWLSPSTPVLSNMGTDRGCPVSCSGNFVGDSVYDFYGAQQENAILSKNGFGTSSYMGAIRERGASISRGGTASGVVPVFKDFVQMSRDISQGSTRRGAWAGYIEIEHGDFWELVDYTLNNPDDLNVGWIITDEFIRKLNQGDQDALARYQKALKVKMVTGKGYFFFVDKVNRLSPPCYQDREFKVLASNLCTEITLLSDSDHTFSCVLSSLNLSKWDEWDKDVIFSALVFLDCVASEFIEIGSQIRGMERVVRFTEKSRALGLGTLGFHTLLQKKMIPFESMDAHLLNQSIFSTIHKECQRATKWMAQEWGEPEWCEGYGIRNTHTTAIAPNLSSAVICGSVSQGIEPIYKNVFIQGSAAGEMERINPVLLEVMKEKNVYTEDVIHDIIEKKGSVQHVDWLNDVEKEVFKTAFEIDQKAILRLASARQRWIDQAQSINLFFAADEDEEYISEVHQLAFEDPWIKSLYYIRSEAGVLASKGECTACEG